MGVVINRGNGGLGRKEPNKDGVIGIIGTGYDGMSVSGILKFTSLSDVDSLGISQAQDDIDGISLWARFNEIYRLNPSAVIYFKPVENTVMLPTMLTNTHVLPLLEEAGGDIRHIGVWMHPASGYTPTILTGLDSNTISALSNAQIQADQAVSSNRPFHVYIEGRSFTGSTSAALDLRTLAYESVSVVVAQDSNIHDIASGNSCVETVLGLVSRSRVNDSIAWVKYNNIQDGVSGSWLAPRLSGGLLLNTYSEADINTLTNKGYIIPKTYPVNGSSAYKGVYMNESNTCASITSDYAYFTENNVMNKAHRLVYSAVLPELNATVKVDKDTGKLPADVCKYYENLGHKALRQMESDGEVSGIDVFVDPDQNILSTGELNITYQITPTGVARQIVNNISFVNPFN